MTNLPTSSAFLSAKNASEATTLEVSCLSIQSEVNKLQKLVLGCIQQFLNESSSKHIALGIDECFRNAYEHGNLGLSSNDKQKLLETERLEGELEKLEKTFGSKKISVKLSISKELLTLSISDEGQGFDWKKRMDEFENADKDTISLRGRGLRIISSAFDSVTYNDLGTTCYLEKKL